MRKFWVAATAVAVLVATACEPARLTPAPHQVDYLTDDAGYYGTGPKVAVLGDSITNSTHDRLHDALPGRGVRTTSMAGEGWAGGPWTQYLGANGPIMVARAGTLAATKPAVAVLALGTNDSWQELLAPYDPLPPLDLVVDTFGPACTVGVLVAETTTADHYDAARAAAINARLRQRVDVVVDWRLTAPAAHIAADGIHLSAAGMAPYTAAVAAGVEACLALPVPTTTTSAPVTSTTTASSTTTSTSTTSTSTTGVPPTTTTAVGTGPTTTLAPAAASGA